MDIESWRREYGQTRYLRKATDDALRRRYDDIAANLWSTDITGRVIPTRNPDHRKKLLRLLVHTVLEQRARDGRELLEFNEAEIREASASSYVAPRLKNPLKHEFDCYTKFGRREHIQDAFDRGFLRIAPASSYDDPSLNPAQFDKELEHVAVTPNQQLLMKVYGLNSEGKEVEIPIEKKELFRYMLVPDFYVWCCSLGYDARLFHEFQYDAALVIRDKDAFAARIASAVQHAVPSAEFVQGPLGYYDPYTIRREELIPIFSKNFRYLYQNEYRFAWKVPENGALEPFCIELGPLHDIAEIVELE